MSFSDMIKKSVINGFSNDVSVTDIIFGMGVALLAALFIIFIYRKATHAVTNNSGYELTLLLTASISSMIVLTITSNLALSLGMVGALSIVRFRTAIKEPSDTAFMFWSVAVGITAGAGFYLIVLLGCLFIGAVVLGADSLNKKTLRPYLLIMRAVPGLSPETVEAVLNRSKIRCRLSSEVTNESYTELIYEIALPPKRRGVTSDLKRISGVTSVSVIDCR